MAVQFEEPTLSRPMPRAKQDASIAGLFVRLGLAKDESSAAGVMLVVTVLLLVGIGAILFFGLPRNNTDADYYQRLELQGFAPIENHYV